MEIGAFLASMEEPAAYSASTRAAYASDLAIFLDYLHKCLGRFPILSDLTTQSIEAFMQAEHKAGRQVSTLLRRRAALLKFNRYLKAQGLIPPDSISIDPRTIYESAQSTSLPEPPPCLSELSQERLFATIQGSQRLLARRDHAILTVLLETGLSVSDLIGLDLSDLDLRAGSMHFVDSEQVDHWLPMGSAFESLSCYVREGRPELNPSPDEPALFISQNGARMSRQSVWQVLRHWGKMADLEVSLSPRILRHTAALRLARSGRSFSEIQVLLGHRNPLSTQALLHRLEAVVVHSIAAAQASEL